MRNTSLELCDCIVGAVKILLFILHRINVYLYVTTRRVCVPYSPTYLTCRVPLDAWLSAGGPLTRSC